MPRAPVAATLLLALLGAASCASETRPSPDAGPPADGAVDAGLADGGVGSTPCGAAVCTADEVCLLTPTGPCVATDGGACPPDRVACQWEGVSGCTTVPTEVCIDVPDRCAGRPSCPCLIDALLCGAAQVACRRGAGEGYRLSCPFP